MRALLLDTHAWIWAAGDAPALGAKARRLLSRTAAAGGLYVSSASMFEITALHTAGRLLLTRPVERWLRESIEHGGLRVVDITPDIAIDAGAIPASALADPLDRLLVATARDLDVPLVTGDRQIAGYARRSRRVQVVNAVV